MPEIARKTIAERERKAPVAPLHTEERGPAVAGDQQRLDAAGAPGDIAARHAAVLGDPRMAEAGPLQRARLMRHLQRGYGNSHVERVMARVQPPQVQRREPPPAEGDERLPTEAERAAALQAAAAAETLAGAARAQGADQASKTAGEKAAEQASAQAAKGRAAAATGAVRSTLQAGKAAARGQPIGSKPGKSPKLAEPSPAAAPPAPGKSPASPQQDAGFRAVVGKIKGAGAQQASHPPASAKAHEAQAAAVSPPAELAGKAQNTSVGKMQQAETPAFDAAGFKARLMERITQLTPKTAKDADEFKESGKVEGVKGALQGDVASERQKSQGPLEQQTQAEPDPSSETPKPVTPLKEEQPGAPPQIAGAEKAAPPPRTRAEVEQPLQAESQNLDKEMAENDISEEQLKKSNEPEFQAAADAKKEAQEHAAAAPQEVRQAEQAQLKSAEAAASAAVQAGVQGMHSDRARVLQTAGGTQAKTRGKDEEERAKVGADIKAIYAETKAAVEDKLNGLDERVSQAFDLGANAARQTFENYVKSRMDAYKERRYGGMLGWARWLKDKVAGMPPEVNAFFTEGRNLYLKEMSVVIDKITAIIGGTITEAKAEIARGKQRISEYVAKLPAHLKGVGKEAADEIQSQFDELEESVKNKENDLIESLAQKYNESLQAVDARIDEMKAANQGLVDKAMGAIKGVVETIKQLKDMLLGVLAKAAGVIDVIIKDPIGFLGNLIGAVKMGLDMFVGRIGEHLKKGLIGWLFGALAEAGIELPQSFDLKGILHLVLQLLGLTYANIRARAVKIIGEPAVARLEQVAEVFKILVTEGPAGLWKFIMDKLGELKEQAMEALRNFIAESVIKAGITWILSLLNPASAFVKACKMIYDIVMFFIERGSQIMSLVNAILDGIGAIAAGSLSAAAAKVEESLAKAVPVAISFLASLLGLGGIAGKVKEVIGKIQKPVNTLIDKVVGGALKLAKKVGGTKLIGKVRAGMEWAKGKAKQGVAYIKAKAQQGKEWAKKRLTSMRERMTGKDKRTIEQKQRDLQSALADADALMKQKDATPKMVKKALPSIKSRYKLNSLRYVTDQTSKQGDKAHVSGTINPAGKTPVEQLTAEDSGRVIRIESELGLPGSGNPGGKTRMNKEKQYPLPKDYGLGKDSASPHQWAHSQGGGTGAESEQGLLLTPEFVNQRLQNHGIELLLRQLVKRVSDDPNMKLYLKTETVAHQFTLRLRSIVYQVEAEVSGGSRRIVLVATINVSRDRMAPTARCSIDYIGSQFQELLLSIVEETPSLARRLDITDE